MQVGSIYCSTKGERASSSIQKVIHIILGENKRKKKRGFRVQQHDLGI
jgi:hypothetical protein